MINTPIALITGGATRLGKALVQTLHQNKFRIALHCNQSQEAAADIVKDLNLIRPNSVKNISSRFMRSQGNQAAS